MKTEFVFVVLARVTKYGDAEFVDEGEGSEL